MENRRYRRWFLAWRTGEAGGRLGLPPNPAEGGPKLSCISCSTCLKNNPVNPVNPVKKEIRKERTCEKANDTCTRMVCRALPILYNIGKAHLPILMAFGIMVAKRSRKEGLV